MLIAALFAVGLFAGVYACLRAGWRLGRRRLHKHGEEGFAGLGALEGGVFGLAGLLIAFTFTSAASRFDARRDLITKQANAIGTAWLRLDLLPAGHRAEIQGLFRAWMDELLAMRGHLGAATVVEASLARLAEMQEAIWTKSVAGARSDPTVPATQVLLPALNDMFDTTSDRVLATRRHPPGAIFVLLTVFVLASALMAGYGMARAKETSRLHTIGFAAVMALAVYLILDLEYPRLGLVRVDRFDQALIELRATME